MAKQPKKSDNDKPKQAKPVPARAYVEHQARLEEMDRIRAK